MHCNSGSYYVTKDLTIWELCGFRVGILQFCPVCSLWTSRAVGSAYKIVTSVTEKKIKTAKSQHGIHKVPRSLNPLSHNNTLNYNALILNANLQQNSTFHALKILHFCTRATHPKL